ncbi:MAG: NADPH-dependent oxidoreductase [Planctomycetota bacterium]|jgi:FMN reductase (NADPH)|nr:NADPH-dependent oxidoreductase [Planctomycetota bacterium]MDA1024962.1 NADPH-dependent oxidoreductase [Planctomycetota bacterium]
MSDVIDVLLSHRSIRRFKPDPIPEEDLRRAVEAGQQAATSSNIQGYCAIRVTDPMVRAQLVPLTGGQAKVASCPLFMAICGDTRRHRLLAAREGGDYQSNLEGFMLAVIDATLFAQNMVIAFESMGYGTCYIGGLREDLPALHEVLRTPEGVWPLFGLCVGLPDQEPQSRPRLDIDAVIFDDHYPADEQILASIDDYDRVMHDWYRSNGIDTPDWSARIRQHFEEKHRTRNAAWYLDAGASFD